MKRLIFQYLKILIPKEIRRHWVQKIEYKKLKFNRKCLKSKILRYYRKSSYDNPQVREVLSFLKKNELDVFPYEFIHKYEKSSIQVFYDKKFDLNYVNHMGRKLFFKRSMSVAEIKSLYRGLQIDQDDNSPHKYLNEEFQVELSDVIVDVGAAEGNFSLEIVEKVKTIYLFENDPGWIEPLKATFAPWKEKVEIIEKKIGSKNNAEELTLDNFYEKKKFTFIKADIEGGEPNLLVGLDKTLSSNFPLKLIICTYHKQYDFTNFNNLLKRKGFRTTTTPGFMIFYYDKLIKPPYLRKALIRAIKND
jgi:hypothetical protein